MSQEYREGASRPHGGAVGPVMQGVTDLSDKFRSVLVTEEGQLITDDRDVRELLESIDNSLRRLVKGLELALNTEL